MLRGVKTAIVEGHTRNAIDALRLLKCRKSQLVDIYRCASREEGRQLFTTRQKCATAHRYAQLVEFLKRCDAQPTKQQDIDGRVDYYIRFKSVL